MRADDVVTFSMGIHREEAKKIADLLRQEGIEDGPQLAAAVENLADILNLASRAEGNSLT